MKNRVEQHGDAGPICSQTVAAQSGCGWRAGRFPLLAWGPEAPAGARNAGER